MLVLILMFVVTDEESQCSLLKIIQMMLPYKQKHFHCIPVFIALSCFTISELLNVICTQKNKSENLSYII